MTNKENKKIIIRAIVIVKIEQKVLPPSDNHELKSKKRSTKIELGSVSITGSKNLNTNKAGAHHLQDELNAEGTKQKTARGKNKNQQEDQQAPELSSDRC